MISALLCSALMITGTAKADSGRSAASSPLPEILQPYVSGAEPELGDYRWLKGSFPSASDEEVSIWKKAKSFGADCYAEHQKRVAAELRAMGVEADEGGFNSIVYDCSAFNGLGIPEGTSWSQFQLAVQRATPLVRGFLQANDFVFESLRDDELSLPEQLQARFIADQMVRNALSANWKKEEAFADLDALQRAVVTDMLGRRLAKVDGANTKFIKRLIEANGWPKSSIVGRNASRHAWLLVQHADAEPAVQLAALRQMENLIETSEVSVRDYAYLYDRVMLKIEGHQRYATQWTCSAGTRTPQPLEFGNEEAERYRATAGLDTIEENARRLDDRYGHCSP